jgi:Leucine-rich repeat (LRR) protein
MENYSNQNLKKIPTVEKQGYRLSLNCSDNKLRYIPKLNHITQLFFRCNRVKKLPYLPNLHFINKYGNKIKDLSMRLEECLYNPRCNKYLHMLKFDLHICS